MGKFTDISVPLDFGTQPTHIVDWNPAEETRSVQGRDGKQFYVIAVKENGRSYDLSLSNKTLLRGLSGMDKPCRLKITRSGEQFATKYTVEKVA